MDILEKCHQLMHHLQSQKSYVCPKSNSTHRENNI